MKDRHAADWEELAQREPYFAVLTSETYLGGGRTEEFFETGEADIAALLPAIESALSRKITITNALDFGCGVGRLTLPLARRATSVVGVDVAPTMLQHARGNAEAAGLHNVTFLPTDELATLPRQSFDFICSLLVMQHIPPSTGYGILRTLAELLAPGGVAALHVTFQRPGSGLRRLARTLRARSRFVHRVVGAARGERLGLPYMQMNEYDQGRVLDDLAAAGAPCVALLPTAHGDTTGAVLIAAKVTAR